MKLTKQEQAIINHVTNILLTGLIDAQDKDDAIEIKVSDANIKKLRELIK